jgi:DNA helicase-2/ATP-dependent DNA helicase PcrA
MPDLTHLNEQQRQAVSHGSGPLLIIAGAGTGKTTVVTKRIEHLILDKKIPPSNILALTFTEKAAQEMETRIDEVLPYGYTTLWIETFHAFCDRVLRQEAINIGLSPRFDLLTEAESLLFLRKRLFDFNLDYFRPLGNPMKFLQGMLTHFSRLKDDDITPEQYINYAKKLEAKRGTLDADEIKKTLELANAFGLYEQRKAKESVMDYSDLISNVLKLFRERPTILKQYQKKFQYVFVDEFQDTNYAQNEMAILLAGERKNITVVGDDDQCLPGDTLITVQQGTKKIKDIKITDTILTAVGKGSLGVSTVKRIFKNKKKTTFITVTTKSGAKLIATANHNMFCYVPKQVKTKSNYYVYLMYRQELGWRLGITNDLAVRLKLERSSDAIIGLRAFQTEKEARYYELLWSLKYRIPTCIFKEREGVMIQDELIKKLYQQFDTEKNAQQLASDLDIDLRRYHYILDAVTRGQSRRVIINFYQCYRNYTQKKIYKNNIMQNPLISHLVYLETANENVIQQLRKHNISFTKARQGIRVRYSSNDIKKAYDFAENLAQITGGFIEMKSIIGTLNQVNMPALIMPAGNLLEGLFVPIIKNNHVYYDEIISISRETKTDTVYDLEIDKTHNFIANGIVVHNSIYRWRGAAIANMMQFGTHFPKAEIVTLTKNYRSTQNILDGAYHLIQNNNPDRLEIKEKIDKKLIGMREIKGEAISFIYTNRGEDEAEEVAKAIQKEVKKTNRPYNEFAILVRANDHSTPFQRALERARIPYQFLGPGHLFQQSEIKDLIAYLHVLANFDDTASLYRIITMSVFELQARDVASILNIAKSSNFTLFEAMEQVGKSSLTQDGKEKITRITDMIKRHLENVPKEEAGQILYYFFEDSGLLGYYLDPGSIKTEKEAQNIAKFFEKLQGFAANHKDASVFAVVDWLDLAMELGESPQAAEVDWTRNNAVNILTVHSSKGLEFPFVFVVNLVAQRFPSRDRKEQIPVPNDVIRETLPEGEEGLQEERRLFYVAITRAQDRLYLTASRFYNEGKRERKVSPFVIETLGEQAVQATIKKQTAEPPGQQLSLLEILNSNIENQNESAKTQIQTPDTITPISYISYSQLQTFAMCPLHYKLKYILNLPSPPTPALSYGSSVHNTLRDFSLLLLQKQKIKPETVKELLEKNWINQGFTSKTHELQTYKQAETILISTTEQILQEKPQTIAVELPFNFWLNQATLPSALPAGMQDKVKVGGRIDRVDQREDGKIEIVDYKTGKNVPSERKVKEDLQLSLYALAATEVKDSVLGRDPTDIILTLFYLEENIKLSTTRTREDIEKAKAEILEKVSAIQTSNFACNHSIFCKTCEYQMLCQAK